jgi:hypothetical protein
MLAGVTGGVDVVNATIDNLVANNGVWPHSVVYPTFMVSPIPEAKLLLYLMRIILELNVPESNTPVEPTLPIGIDHIYPIELDEDTGTEYLNTLAPQLLLTNVCIIDAGGVN